MTATANTIWIDTTTLFRTFRRGGTQVTGIPRVVAECVREALLDPDLGPRVRLCRASAAHRTFAEVPRSEVEALLAESHAPVRSGPSLRDQLRRILPPAAIDRLTQLERGVRSGVGRLRGQVRPNDAQGTVTHPFVSGDVWISFGCWWHEDLPDLIAEVKQGIDLCAYVTIHDCMPLAFPEFFPREQVRMWHEGSKRLQTVADGMFVISEHTGRDVRQYLPNYSGPMHLLRLGDMFMENTRPGAMPGDPDAALKRLGLHDPFVLVVGTIEARKNHILAFRTWRALIRQGIDPPKLVFAGKWGWKVSDLAEEIADADALDGRLVVIESPTDADLGALYNGALFTLFPSHYEGWGLPVRESLACGRICIAARNSAIVEAAGTLADLFENNCQPDLERLVTTYLDADTRAKREAHIAKNFEVFGWDETWAEVRAALKPSLTGSA